MSEVIAPVRRLNMIEAINDALDVMMARDPDVARADFHTRWLEPWLEANAHRLETEDTPE